MLMYSYFYTKGFKKSCKILKINKKSQKTLIFSKKNGKGNKRYKIGFQRSKMLP